MSASLGLGGSATPAADRVPSSDAPAIDTGASVAPTVDRDTDRWDRSAPSAPDPRDRRPTERRFDDRRGDRPAYERATHDRPSYERRADGPRGGDRGPRDGGFRSRDPRAPREPEFGSRRRVEDIGEAWPEIPEWATSDELDPEVRRDLRGLSREGADFVAAHLVAASALADEDPELAWRHARAARTRGGRIAVVRETVGLVAYRAGEWAEAIGELRAARRMSGGPGQLAVLADCERALGHPERAIELSRSPEAAAVDEEQRIELGIVSAGARADLGQTDAAVAQLEQLAATAGDSPRVAFAYADLLEQVGRREDAIRWFIKAADADLDEETDAGERLQRLGADPAEVAPTDASDDDVESAGAVDDAVHTPVETAVETATDGAVDAAAPDNPSAADVDAPDAASAETGLAGDGSADTVSEPTAATDGGDPTSGPSRSAVTAHPDRPDADQPDPEASGPTVADEVAGRPPFVEAPAPAAAAVADRADGDPSSDPADDEPVAATSSADGHDAGTAEAPAAERSVADDAPSSETTSPPFPGAPLFSDNPGTGA